MVQKTLAILLFLILLWLIPQRSFPSEVVKYDLNINGTIGVVVFPKREEYDFHVKSKGDLDYFFVSNCHRYHAYEDAGNVKKTIFKIKETKEIKLTYIPTEIEQGFCPLEFAAFDKNVYSKGMVFFKQDDLQLVATINCDGDAYDSKGVSACQAKTGTTQKIVFPREVEYVAPCKSAEKKKGVAINIIVKSGMCSYYFIDQISKKKHRLTILGFDKVNL